MKIHEKIEKLKKIYDRFEREVAEFKEQAVCGLGCTFCCTFMGNIDMTTLEGLIIRRRIKDFPEPLQDSIGDRLTADAKNRDDGRESPCPFLEEDGSCLIYDVRPFSCRKLYSIRKCDDGGPMVHRRFHELAGEAIREIQLLDDTGYSGHHSYILYLLARPGFRRLYMTNGFDPGMIRDYGRKHGIIINRWVK